MRKTQTGKGPNERRKKVKTVSPRTVKERNGAIHPHPLSCHRRKERRKKWK
jgi:hypothetical protein